VRALAVPLVIRTVRHADRLGEALAARGVDDDPDDAPDDSKAPDDSDDAPAGQA
jgi:biotin transport system permease protein